MSKREASLETPAKRRKCTLTEQALLMVCQWLAEQSRTNSHLMATCKAISGMFDDMGKFKKKTIPMLTVHSVITLDTQTWILQLNGCPFRLVDEALRNGDLAFYFYWKQKAGYLSRPAEKRALSAAVISDNVEFFAAMTGGNLATVFNLDSYMVLAGENGSLNILKFFWSKHGLNPLCKWYETHTIPQVVLDFMLPHLGPNFTKDWTRDYIMCKDVALLQRIYLRSGQLPVHFVASHALTHNRLDILEWYVSTGQKLVLDCDYISGKTSIEVLEYFYNNRDTTNSVIEYKLTLLSDNPAAYHWLAEREPVTISASSIARLLTEEKISISQLERIVRNGKVTEYAIPWSSGYWLKPHQLQWLAGLGFKFCPWHLAFAFQDGNVAGCRVILEQKVPIFSHEEFQFPTEWTPELFDLLYELFPDREALLNMLDSQLAKETWIFSKTEVIKPLVERGLVKPERVMEKVFATCNFKLFDWLVKDMAEPPRFAIPELKNLNLSAGKKAFKWLGSHGYKGTMENIENAYFLAEFILLGLDAGFFDYDGSVKYNAFKHCEQRAYMEVMCWRPNRPRNQPLDELLAEFKSLELPHYV